jgi:hypothetical protein
LFGVGLDRLSLRAGETKKIQWIAGTAAKKYKPDQISVIQKPSGCPKGFCVLNVEMFISGEIIFLYNIFASIYLRTCYVLDAIFRSRYRSCTVASAK